MKIYTKTGDDGTSGLFAGGRIGKDSSRLHAYGDVDELNSVLGSVQACIDAKVFGNELERLQRALFVLGADLATPLSAKVTYAIPRINAVDIGSAEQLIDSLEKELLPLTQFILPGGSEIACRLHLARTVARRAEREIVALSKTEDVGPFVLPYINRLSDLFFVMARYANHKLGVPEPTWDGKREG